MELEKEPYVLTNIFVLTNILKRFEAKDRVRMESEWGVFRVYDHLTKRGTWHGVILKCSPQESISKNCFSYGL